MFVPLCGKSIDMIYLISNGYKVVGVELSELGVKHFFNENDIEYSVKELNEFVVYYNSDITIYCGDFFNLSSDMLNTITGIYDRASLIALPEKLRQKYVSHLYSIIPYDSNMLLLTINYPQSELSGPPFAVSDKEVNLLYSKNFDYKVLERIKDNVEPKFKQVGIESFETATYCLYKKKRQ